MTRRRYVTIDGVLTEVPLDWSRDAPKAADTGLLWNDRLYQDDGDKRYTSRSTHRQYMKDNDLSMHSDYTETWAKAAKERAGYRESGVDPSRKADVIHAVHKLINGR